MGLQLIKGFGLIDGKGGPLVEKGAILTEGPIILRAGASNDVVIPEGATISVHDFPGCTILPGLINTHTHLNMPGNGQGIFEVMSESDEMLLFRSAANARTALRAGITTVRDNGGRGQTILSLRDALKRGVETGPRLNICGRPLTITGGHCWPMGGEVEGIENLKRAVRQAIKEGADFIKVMATGGGTPGTFPFLPAYSSEELRAIVEEAHRFGKQVGAHCLCAKGIEYALNAEFDALFHCLPGEPDGSWKLRRDLLDRIAQIGVWVNPTIHVQRNRYWWLLKMKEREGGNPALDAELNSQKEKWEFAQKNLRQMKEAGVRVVAGDDAGWGNVRFDEFIYELEHMQLDGFSSMEVILSATREAANFLEIGDIVGTLEQGKEADILVVRGNPLKDLMDLSKVMAVFKAGERIR